MLLDVWIFVQIIVESLPISSSGHVIMVQKLLEKFGFEQLCMSQLWHIDFLLHGPTIVIVMIYFFKQWWNMMLPGKAIDVKVFFKSATWVSLIDPIVFIGIVDFMTIVFWWCDFGHYPWIQNYFLPIGFIHTAIVLSVVGFAKNTTTDQRIIWNKQNAFYLGIAQGISLLPGISRFASTYGVARLVCGYNASMAFAISFLIQFPLICAGFFKGLLVVQKTPDLMIKLFAFHSLFVMLIASLLSYCLLCWVGHLIKKNKLYYFAWYMIIPIVMSLFLCKGV